MEDYIHEALKLDIIHPSTIPTSPRSFFVQKKNDYHGLNDVR